MKKIYTLIVLCYISFYHFTFAAKPNIDPYGLPGDGTTSGEGKTFFVGIIDQFIGIILVLAVFALVFSGIFYLISGGKEEQVARAKRWIIWSLIGVFLAAISWGIVNFLNNINISLG